jgi:zinc transporter ZupT
MEPIAQLPAWAQAAAWGVLSASGLLIGAAAGCFASLRHAVVARSMTFAAGVLLAAVAVDLVTSARGAAGVRWSAVRRRHVQLFELDSVEVRGGES